MTEPDEALLWGRGDLVAIIAPVVAIAITAFLAWVDSVNRQRFKPTEGGRPMTEAERIKELEARVAELERRLSGGAGGTPLLKDPAYDPRPIATCFDWSPPPAKMSGYRK